MLSFETSTPNKLLAAIKSAIDSKKIETWIYNKDGYFTHAPEQWKAKAWLKPTVVAGKQLNFGIVRPQNGKVNTEVYAVYHGRFAEMMLAHFDKEFSTAAATALAGLEDNVAA